MHFRGPEGLTIVFGQFEGADQEKIGGMSRNRGEHAEKRDLKLCAYTRLARGVKFFPEGLRSPIWGAK